MQGWGGPHEARKAILDSRKAYLDKKEAERWLTRKRDRFYRARLRAFHATLDAIVWTGHNRFRVVVVPVKHAFRADFVAFFIANTNIVINSRIICGSHAWMDAPTVPRASVLFSMHVGLHCGISPSLPRFCQRHLAGVGRMPLRRRSAMSIF
jgi:hypothetical protein